MNFLKMFIRTVTTVLLLAWAAPVAAAETEPEPPELVLPPLAVTAPPPAGASSEILIPSRDFDLRPKGRPADVLRLVPGLVISQHQGGGKAEQYFLRGFDADHGTDVALFVDGLPVNLRSHAHGQGYADLQFLIPETVRQVEAFKGPYYVRFGDFATAGAVNFVTRDAVDENTVEAAGGMFGTQRYLALLSPTQDALKTLVAVEGFLTDGPFVRFQNYHRFNIFAKASRALADGDFSLWGSYYRATWDGSGQIPSRAVRAGLIGRFGSIDNSEGGDTHRANVNADFRWRPSDSQVVTVHAYGQYYALDLFSNFTFFLDDPVNGDGIAQLDRRWVAGLDAEYRHRGTLLGVPATGAAGLQFRMDRPRVILARQAGRREVGRTQDVNVIEASYAPFVKLDLIPRDWLHFNVGARGDIFRYEVSDNLNGQSGPLTGNATRAVPGVKANLILGPWYRTELFANLGTGFHSNDARATILNPRMTALPSARGYEFGLKTRPDPRVVLSTTYWTLDLESELVFQGDAGTTEPRGRSHREGWEVATRVKLLDWLSFAGDVTVSRAGFTAGGAVPLAPRLTARADLTARLPWGLATSLGMRHLGDRFASEDRRQTATGYTLFDLTAHYRYKMAEAFVSIENLFDVDYREAQFFFTSRLRGEPAGGVEDIHFTPGTPRKVLGGVAMRF